MRDESRMKEKFEVSLDGPQVASIVVGALVILGGVFVLGLNVGKQLAVREPRPVAAPADPLAALDAPAPSDPKDPEPKLSYHEELTKEPPRSKPAPPRPNPPQATDEAKPSASVPSLPAPSSDPIPQPAPKPKPKQEPKTKPEPKPEPKALSEAGLEPKTVPAVRKLADAAPSPSPTEGVFAIQVGASQSLDEAERISDKFKPYRPRIVTGDVPGKGRWYRVRLGAFETREDANRYLADLVRETGATGFVISTRAAEPRP